MYPMEDNLARLKLFYELAIVWFSSEEAKYAVVGRHSKIAMAQPVAVAEQAREVLDNKEYLFITVTTMLCSIWEGFRNHLRASDPAKYAQHFQPGYEKYYNDPIKEMFLIRNCLLHSGGIADSDYQRLSSQPKYQLGAVIKLRKEDIDHFFDELEKSYIAIAT